MIIEVWKGKGGQWRWHFKSKGRVTADSEGFPSKSNAIRAAKAVVRAVVKTVYTDITFYAEQRLDVTTIRWN